MLHVRSRSCLFGTGSHPSCLGHDRGVQRHVAATHCPALRPSILINSDAMLLTCCRVSDDHVFFWKGVIPEPCYFGSKSLLTGMLSRNNSALHSRMVAAFKSNVYWMQYSQCHWNPERSEF